MAAYHCNTGNPALNAEQLTQVVAAGAVSEIDQPAVEYSEAEVMAPRVDSVPKAFATSGPESVGFQKDEVMFVAPENASLPSNPPALSSAVISLASTKPTA